MSLLQAMRVNAPNLNGSPFSVQAVGKELLEGYIRKPVNNWFSACF
jgi:hypothetical protein